MKGSRFSEEQIIGIVKEQEAGAKTADICPRHGISDATFYKWEVQIWRLGVSEAKRLKALEDGNAKLKKLLAESMLENTILKDIAAKSDARSQAGCGRSCPAAFGASDHRACEVIGIARGVQCYVVKQLMMPSAQILKY